MLNLHFIYTPHWRGESALWLWGKLKELHEQGKKILFVGTESAGEPKENKKTLDRLYAKIQDNLKEVGVTPALFLEKYPDRKILRVLISPFSKKFEGQGEHTLSLHTVAAAANLPALSLEQTQKMRARNIRGKNRGLKLLHGKIFGAKTLDEMLNTFKQYYFEDTSRANERHKIVASTLRKLVERYDDGDAVVVFGAEHGGMEEYVRKQMEKHKTKAQVMTTEKEILEPTIYHELAEKRRKDPTFKPADEELAKAFLHDIVSAFIAKNIREEMGWKKGDIDHDLRLFRYKGYRDAVQETCDTIRRLDHSKTKEWITRFAKEKGCIERFMEYCSGESTSKTR